MTNRLLSIGFLMLLLLPAKSQVGPSTAEERKNALLAVIDSCKKAGDKLKEEATWKELAVETGIEQSLLPFKQSCYENAMALAAQRDDKNAEMDYFRNIADIHLQQGKLDLAERELFGILKEAKNIKPVYTMYTYDLLSAVYIFKGQYDSALSYGLKTVRLMQAIGDSGQAATFYDRLSAIYDHLGKPAESLEWAKKALVHADVENAGSDRFTKVNYVAYRYLRQGKAREALAFMQEQLGKKKPVTVDDQRNVQRTLGDCYVAVKDYNQAERSYLEMLRRGDEQGNDLAAQDRAYDNCSMGTFYYGRGNYQKALFFIENALKNYEKSGLLPHRKLMHSYLFKVDSALGNYVGAIKQLNESNRLGDSIFTIEKNQQIEELQVKYETDEKDKNLKLLEGKEKLAQAKLAHAVSTRSWIIAGACMLLIIAGLLYRQTRMRKRNNRIIHNKNDQLQHLVKEKEWLLKEVHHRVKNNLHTVIGLLESQAAYLEDDALKANEISKHRIYAMSLIHQQLYKAEDIKTIDMSVYLPELVDYLGESFGTGRQIRFQLAIEPLKLGVSQAIPIALIVNEAVTNSIKYAYPSGKPGTISVRLQQTGEQINLEIADDGIGMDPAITEAESTSLGLKPD